MDLSDIVKEAQQVSDDTIEQLYEFNLEMESIHRDIHAYHMRINNKKIEEILKKSIPLNRVQIFESISLEIESIISKLHEKMKTEREKYSEVQKTFSHQEFANLVKDIQKVSILISNEKDASLLFNCISKVIWNPEQKSDVKILKWNRYSCFDLKDMSEDNVVDYISSKI